jgi:hypothetical protein
LKTVIVTGSRNWIDHLFIYEKLDAALKTEPFDHLVQGGARGADRIAAQWCRLNKIKCTQVDAQWDLYGKAAGMRRNREMLGMFPDAWVIAFPIGESRGTRGCIAEARKRGMVVVVYEG